MLVRRELKKIVSDVKIDIDQIRSVLETEVLKREVVEGDKADAAKKKVLRAARKAIKASAAEISPTSDASESLKTENSITAPTVTVSPVSGNLEAKV
jgi:hypothetical protein